ncbi:MAG TPA: hypothetical protein VI796_04320, partial [Candidatus Thermoplasmatota archaeon]|nr:hypothetical protein [Candidatus Thermoplasmatota archaeon]
MPPFEENRLAGAPRSPPGRIAVAALLALLVLAALLGPSPAPPPSPEAPRDAALAHLAALHGLGQGASGAVPAPYLVEAAAAAGLDPGAWPSAAH